MTAGIELTVRVTGGPHVELLDANSMWLDADGLRDWARTRAAARGGTHVGRSYRYPFALIAWHTEPIGVDIERVEAYDETFAESICTPSERAAGLPPSAEELASLWCGKEALAKALGDATRYDPRRLKSAMHWPEGKSGLWRAAALKAPAGHVAWVCWHADAA
jgi:phosphopantetheinyl transferase